MAVEGFPDEQLEQEGQMITHEKGLQMFQVTRLKKKQIFVRPEFAAIKYVLSNLKRGTFANNPKPIVGVDDRPTALEIIIKGGSVEPVTSEDDIKDVGI